MPDGDPTHYKSYADYILKADGTVTDSLGTPVSVGTWFNFTFSGGQWQSTSRTPIPPTSTLYFETDVKIQGNCVFTNTMIIEGSLELRGTGSGADFDPSLGGVSVLAGGDIKISGNAEISGFVVAREQISLKGNCDIVDGGAISIDEFDNSSVVTTTSSFDNTVEGNPTIQYKGNVATFLKVPVYSLDLQAVRRLK
jgi:hypothetical protein